MHELELFHLPGPPADAGFAHGRALAHFFQSTFFDAYIASLCAINRVEHDDMFKQADRWLARLPEHFQIEIDAMASGARTRTPRVAAFLYADIARPTDAVATRDPAHQNPAASPEDPANHTLLGGPMCSAVALELNGRPWVARNCDWLTATLVRGTAAVVHEVPGRIPVMALGIKGDIDIDTGVNAERLWLHLHTLYSPEEPRGDRTQISWLFWAREALETCATLDELDRFIASTDRDRGVIVVAADAKSNERALFECARSGHRRIDAGDLPLIATNHPQHKHPTPERAAKSRPGATLARYCAVRDLIAETPPEHGPDDLIDLLADPGVEMRTPTHLRTIYSAVADPARGDIWFAAGSADGSPAASTGGWLKAPWLW